MKKTKVYLSGPIARAIHVETSGETHLYYT